MSNKRKNSRRDTQTLELGLAEAKAGLTLLGNVADGFSVVPGLQSVVQISIQLINVAMAVKDNKSRCLDLADRTVALTEVLIESTRGKHVTAANQGLVEDIQRFGAELEEICTAMTLMVNRKIWHRFLAYSNDLAKILKWQACLDDAVHSFQIYESIRSHFNQLEADHCNMRAHEKTHELVNKVHTQVQDLFENPLSSVDQDITLSAIPPPKPKVFYGRDDLVMQCLELIIHQQPARLAILGGGGMGKTTLALAILHHSHIHDFFHDNRFFVPCDSATTPSLLLSCILTILGTSRNHSASDPLKSLHNLLKSSGPLLLVLDNFETPYHAGSQAEVDHILRSIDSFSQVTLIITMRGHATPGGILWTNPKTLVPLQTLSLAAAKSAFLQLNPHCNQLAELEQLLLELDCMPLAITLVAQLAKLQPCNVLRNRWRKEKTMLIKTEDGQAHRLTNIEVSICLSLDSTLIKQDPDAVRLLALISHLPDGILKWEENLPKLASALDNAFRASAALLHTGLVYVLQGALKVLSPIREYIQHQHPPIPGALDDVRALENYYIEMITEYQNWSLNDGTYKEAYDVLAPETANIIYLFTQGLTDHAYDQLAIASIELSRFLLWSRPSESINVLDVLLPQLSSLQFDHMEPICLYFIAEASRLQTRYQYAKHNFQQAFRLFSEADDMLGASRCLHGLGHISHMEDNFADAKDQYDQAFQQFSQADDQVAATECLKSLGDILFIETKYTEAKEKYEQAHVQFMAAGDYVGATQCMQCLGDILYMQGRYEEANKILNEAHIQSKETGNELGAIQCLKSLGNILHMQANYEDAKSMLRTAHDQFLEIDDLLGASQCLLNIAEILFLQAKYSEAKKHLEQANLQFTTFGDRLDTAYCTKSLANILCMEGNYSEARDKLDQSHQYFEIIGDQLATTQCLQNLGEMLYMQASYTDAEEKMQQAYIAFTNLGIQPDAASCLHILGDILHHQHKYPEAMEYLQQAHLQLSNTGYPHGIAQCLRSMGDVLFKQGDSHEAQEKLAEALSLSTHIGDRLGANRCLWSLGNVLQMQEDYEGAITKFQTAEAEFTCIGYRLGIAECLTGLGNVFAKQGNITKARMKLVEAEMLYKEMGIEALAKECQERQDALVSEADLD